MEDLNKVIKDTKLRKTTSIIGGFIELEKARSGVYADTPENRKLGRVGQKYGSKKEDNSSEDKDKSKESKEKKTPTSSEDMNGDSVTIGDTVSIPSNLTNDPNKRQGQSGEVIGINKHNDIMVEFKDGGRGVYTEGSFQKDNSKEKSLSEQHKDNQDKDKKEELQKVVDKYKKAKEKYPELDTHQKRLDYAMGNHTFSKDEVEDALEESGAFDGTSKENSSKSIDSEEEGVSKAINSLLEVSEPQEGAFIGATDLCRDFDSWKEMVLDDVDESERSDVERLLEVFEKNVVGEVIHIDDVHGEDELFNLEKKIETPIKVSELPKGHGVLTPKGMDYIMLLPLPDSSEIGIAYMTDKGKKMFSQYLTGDY